MKTSHLRILFLSLLENPANISCTSVSSSEARICWLEAMLSTTLSRTHCLKIIPSSTVSRSGSTGRSGAPEGRESVSSVSILLIAIDQTQDGGRLQL